MKTTELIKKLRSQTGLGILDCKKALDATKNNYDAAVKHLQKIGKTKFLNKVNRDTNEGMIHISFKNDKCSIVSLKCETDFVAKNSEFQKEVDLISNTVLNTSINNVDKCLLQDINGKTIKDRLIELSNKTGENISLSMVNIIDKNTNDCFGVYNHSNNKLGAVIILENSKDEDLARSLAMQVCAMAPEYISIDDVKENEINAMKENIKKNLDDKIKNKPENILNKIIEGRLLKDFSDIVLLEQNYVKDTSLKIKQLIKNNNTKILFSKRFTI